MVRAIISKSNNQQIGNLVLVVRPEYFSTIFNDVALGSGTEIYVLDASSNKLIVRADDTSTNADETAGETAEPGLIDKIAHNRAIRQAEWFRPLRGQAPRALLCRVLEDSRHDMVCGQHHSGSEVDGAGAVGRDQIILVGILGFLLSIFLAYFISHSISAPLKELVRKMHDTGNDAGAQAEDGAQALTNADGEDELGRLAQRFERMREAIKQKIQKINEINASLEQTVIERTAELVTKEHESRTLIENSPDTITRYDRDLHRIYANPRSVARRGAAWANRSASGPRKFPAALTR